MRYPVFAVLLGFAYIAAEEESEEERDLYEMLQAFPDVAEAWDEFVMKLPSVYDLKPQKIAETMRDMVRFDDLGWPTRQDSPAKENMMMNVRITGHVAQLNYCGPDTELAPLVAAALNLSDPVRFPPTAPPAGEAAEVAALREELRALKDALRAFVAALS